MPAFSYAALDNRGKEKRGIIEADSSRQVRQQLRDQGLAPLRVTAAMANRPAGTAATGWGRRGPTMKVAELALVTRQMSTLLASAMPLEESLSAVARQSESSKTRSIVLEVRSRVLQGHTLANSLSAFPRAFPILYRATVAAGEHAGHLDLVLTRLADYSERVYASRQKAMLAMIYPIILFFMAISIVTGLMAFVVPDIVEVFVTQGQDLPLLTRGLIALSNFIVHYGLVVLLVLGLLSIAAHYLLQNPVMRRAFHHWLLRVPVFGRFIRASNTARYASTLSILTSSGVPLVDAMNIAAEVIGNTYLQRSVQGATQQVREGGSLHQALETCRYFPPIMIHMIASGELSGRLDEMLQRVADAQQQELDSRTAMMIGIFEPAMLLFMGAAVLIIVIAILQPIFNLNTLI